MVPDSESAILRLFSLMNRVVSSSFSSAAIFPGTTHCVCELCGLEGTLEIVDDAFKFKFDPADEHKAHDTLSGKKLHGDDIFKNEGRLINLFKDPEFKARKEHYTNVIAPTPAPSK